MKNQGEPKQYFWKNVSQSGPENEQILWQKRKEVQKFIEFTTKVKIKITNKDKDN